MEILKGVFPDEWHSSVFLPLALLYTAVKADTVTCYWRSTRFKLKMYSSPICTMLTACSQSTWNSRARTRSTDIPNIFQMCQYVNDFLRWTFQTILNHRFELFFLLRSRNSELKCLFNYNISVVLFLLCVKCFRKGSNKCKNELHEIWSVRFCY